LAFASAGHLSPLLCGERDEPAYLGGFHSLPLGIQADLRCATQVHNLLPDQAILLYTDGVVEARDAQRRFLGFDALQAIVAHQPSERLIDTILERVSQFVGPVALQDDLTLVVVKRIE
jgi:phosphoserine phosphatase RsbU/P